MANGRYFVMSSKCQLLDVVRLRVTVTFTFPKGAKKLETP